MKKLLVTLLVLLGLQTQAQINLCDSLVIGGSQYQVVISANNINTIIEEWTTTTTNGDTLQQDSMTNIHTVFNFNPIGPPYDTLYTCMIWGTAMGNQSLCCQPWVWYGTYWAKMGTVTGINEMASPSTPDGKIYDLLGRELKEVPKGTPYIRDRKLYITN
jgi:hypothetical protein